MSVNPKKNSRSTPGTFRSPSFPVPGFPAMEVVTDTAKAITTDFSRVIPKLSSAESHSASKSPKIPWNESRTTFR